MNEDEARESGHGHGHGHAHEIPESGGRLAGVVGLNLVITVAEVVGGVLSGSFSLLSDAVHNFSDGIAVIIAYVAIRMNRLPRSDRHTFGLKRAEVVAAVINSGTLVAISVWLFYEAYQRFRHPTPVEGVLMTAVAAIGLVANVIGTLLLKRGASKNMNLRAAYLHLLSDAVSSVGVIVGGVAISVFGIFWIDPLLTVLISIYVLKESLQILWRALDVVLLASPPNLSLEELRQAVLAQPGVQDIHHIHLWQATEDDTHFEAHVKVEDQPLGNADDIRQTIEDLLHESYGIRHTTLQLECIGSPCATGELC
jgi:cobalt-zinc-cadmium efflux system protein